MNDTGTPLPPETPSAPAEEGSAPRKPRRKRTERQASRGSRRAKFALIGIALMLVITSPWWAPLLLRRMEFFRVRRVEIVGARYVAPADIVERLHVDTTASVWDPTGPLSRRVAALTEVRTVDIRRKLPGTLIVEITERSPIALVPSPAGLRPYDERGVALPIDPSRQPVDAPIVDAPDTRVLRFLSELRKENLTLYQRVSEVRRVGPDELLFQLSPAVPVRAMKDVTVQRLADVGPVESDLARRQLQPTELDLRYRDQVIARVR